MRRKLFLTIFIACLFQIGFAQLYEKFGLLERRNDSIFVVENGKHYIANKNVVTVKLKSGKDVFGITAQKIRSNRLGFIDLIVPEGTDLEEYVSALENSGEFEVVEYNSIGEYCLITDDTEGHRQWYLSNINAFNAWDIVMGHPNIFVAILDSGTDWRHPDIGNGSDGYNNINEQAGWNYISGTNNVITNNGHGTRVAGIVAAKSNNNRGISGISGGNNSAGITMIPFCVGVNAPDNSIIDDAIIDAVDFGVRVIQLSLSVAQTNAINAAINYAVQNNVTIVCASGNGYSSTVNYPASHQNVIAVGATNKNNNRAGFSNYGTSLDIVAPGVDILSTSLGNGYNSQDGTSFASPQVSGIAALMFSVRPELTGQQVRNIIEQTAQKVGGYSYTNQSGQPNGTWNEQMGYGLVDAYAAVYAVAPRISGPTIVCTTNATFTLNNPPDGCTVTWSHSSNLAYVSGQGTSYTVRAANTTVNGPGWVQATVSGLCGDVELPPYSVYVGTPPGRIGPPLINGQSVFCIWPNQSATVSVTSHPEVTNYLWVLHNEAEFPMLLGKKQTTIPFSVSGNYPQRILELTEQIPGCSSVTSQKNLVFCEDFDMLSVGPNPASEVITIAELDNDKSSEPWTLRLVSQQGAIAVNVTTTLPKTINVSGIQQGVYILHAKKGNHVEQHRVAVE